MTLHRKRNRRVKLSNLEHPKQSGGDDTGLIGYIGTVWKKENAVVIYNRKTHWYDNLFLGLYPLPILRTIGVYKGNISNLKKDDKVFVRLKTNGSIAVKMSLSIGFALSTFSNIEYVEKVS